MRRLPYAARLIPSMHRENRVSPRRIAKALAGLGALALIALLATTIYVVHHRPSVQTLSRAAGLVPNSLLHAHNFHWTQLKAGTSQWTLSAKDASYSVDKTSLELNQPVLNMTAQDGNEVKVTAAHATLLLDGNHVKRADLSGGTNIRYGAFTLTTDRASFMPDEDKVQAPGAVSIVGDGFKVTGVGLDGNPKTHRFELLNQVSTEIIPKTDAGKSKKG
jgi:LPS export ABC transporter protein LptC